MTTVLNLWMTKYELPHLRAWSKCGSLTSLFFIFYMQLLNRGYTLFILNTRKYLKLTTEQHNKGNHESAALYWLLMPAGSVTQQLHQTYHPPLIHIHTQTQAETLLAVLGASCANIDCQDLVCDFLKQGASIPENTMGGMNAIKIINLGHGKEHRLHKRHKLVLKQSLPVDRWSSPGCWISPLKWKIEHNSQPNRSKSFCMYHFYTVIIKFQQSEVNYLL